MNSDNEVNGNEDKVYIDMDSELERDDNKVMKEEEELHNDNRVTKALHDHSKWVVLKLNRNNEEDAKVQTCNFDSSGNLILYYTLDKNENSQSDRIDIVGIYSIQTKAKCEQTYQLPKGAEVISISSTNKIWLRFNDHIYEWNLKTGKIMIISTILIKVISKVF